MWVNPAMPKLEFPTTAKTHGKSWISTKRGLNGWEFSSFPVPGTHARRETMFLLHFFVLVLTLVFSTCCCPMSLSKVSCFPMNLQGATLIGCCTSCSGCTCGQSHESSPLRPCCSRCKAPKSAKFFSTEDKSFSYIKWISMAILSSDIFKWLAKIEQNNNIRELPPLGWLLFH